MQYECAASAYSNVFATMSFTDISGSKDAMLVVMMTDWPAGLIWGDPDATSYASCVSSAWLCASCAPAASAGEPAAGTVCIFLACWTFRACDECDDETATHKNSVDTFIWAINNTIFVNRMAGYQRDHLVGHPCNYDLSLAVLQTIILLISAMSYRRT